MVKNIVPNTKEPTATADIDTLSPDQPMAQLNKDVPELGSNDIVVSFSECSIESLSSVESETAVSHHQPAILPAKVTSSMINNIVPNTKEPAATADIDTPSPDQPTAQLNKDVPELGSNDIVVSFSECSIESLSSVESETAVSQHQPAILPAKVTSSMVNNIVPNTKEPTATADIDTLSPDQPMAQLNKDVPELGSNDIVVSFSECSIESLSSVESETAVFHHQPAILPAKVTSSMVKNIVPNTKEPTATADIDTLSPDQPMAQLNKDVPELGSNDIVVSFSECSIESLSSVEAETAVSHHQPAILPAKVTSSMVKNIVPNTKEPTATADIDTLSPDQPMAQLNKDVPELGSNDIVVSFSECSIESLSSVESETAVSHHQPAILPAKVTSSMVNNIVPNTKEPTQPLDIDTPIQPDHPWLS
eukprot:gene1701-16177_t